MTVADQIKILERKVMQNEAHYDLDRKAVKISALSFNKFFNKGLKEEDKKEGLWEILKDIEGKNEEHLKAIEDQTKIICRNKINPPLLKSMYSQVKK